MMRALVVLVALLAYETPARAMCALRSWMSPSGPVPVRGSVFSYTDGAFENEPPRVEWFGGRGTATITPVSPSVTRIDYEGPAGASIVVSPGFLKAGETAPYYQRRFVLTTWQPPRVPALRSIKREEGAWTCSSYDDLQIELDGPAAALRARWTRLDLTFDDYWLVGHEDTYELGKVDCGGTTLSPRDIDDGGVLTLTAVLADGSEYALGSVLVRSTPFGTVLVPTEATFPWSDVPWAAIVTMLVLVGLAIRSVRAPNAATSLPSARVARRS